jgi:hypothetical protein
LLLEKIKQYLGNDDLRLKSSISNRDFIRRRRLPFTTLIAFMVNLVRKSLQVEIGSFSRATNTVDFTKQAFSKARKKLSPIAFQLLNEKLVSEFYTDNDFKLFKGLRVLAIDGSTLRLPDEEELYKHFGRVEHQKSVPIARISMVYDILNNITLHAVLGTFYSSERDMAKQNINEICKFGTPLHNSGHEINDLLIFDRGYPSAAFMHFLQVKRKHFLIRLPNNSLNEVSEVVNSGMNDSIVNIPFLNKDRRKSRERLKFEFEINENEFLNARVLVFELPDNQKEILITSLIDKEKFTYEDIFKLYKMRWNQEENYKFYKCIAEIENFSGKSKLAIEQDFHATVFTCNIAAIIAQEAQDELDQEAPNQDRKYEYKINRNVLIGTIKNEIAHVLLSDQNLDEYCTKLKSFIKKSLVPIRTGRSYPRIRRGRNREIKIHKECL